LQFYFLGFKVRKGKEGKKEKNENVMGKEEERFHHLCFTRASLGHRGAVKSGLPPFYVI